MAYGFAVAGHVNGRPHFEVCPNWDATNKVCNCSKDAAGLPVPPHATYDFGPSPDARTIAQWVVGCAGEVKALVKATAAAPATLTTANALSGTAIQ